MDPAEFKRVRCDSCGLSTPSYDIVNSGSIEKGYRQLCGRCFNAEVAKWVGLEKFENLKFEPVVIADCTGTPHEFHFRTHLFGTGVAIDAFELRGDSPAGYQFQVIANPETDLLVLLGKLIEKIRRGLSTKYLIDGEFGRHVGDDQVVQGRITWDEAEDGRVPLLIIDGREISWDEFGRMLMSFEGFQFKLKIADASEDL